MNIIYARDQVVSLIGVERTCSRASCSTYRWKRPCIELAREQVAPLADEEDPVCII